jgi:calcineurin-like phosphoesterase family protein
MSKIHLISDTHFYHENMAKRRGFSSVEEMNELIVSNWNKTINKKDVVWILGDITMGRKNYDILDRLNGIKKVVLGNHDMPQHVPELLKHVNKVCGSIRLNNAILTHIPIHPQELLGKIQLNIHGHIHEKQIDDDRFINVSCEAVNYTPICYEDISHIYRSLVLRNNS